MPDFPDSPLPGSPLSKWPLSKWIDAVLFDMDGVLVSSDEVWYRLIVDATRAYGHPEPTRDRFLEGFGQGIDADVKWYVQSATPQALLAFYDRHYEEHLGLVTLIPGASRLLKELRRRRVKTAVVTNTPVRLARLTLDATRLAPLLDVVAASGEAAEKPAPDLIDLAIDRLAVKKERAIYVGDSATDVAAAAAAGVRSITFCPGGDIVVETLEEVSRRLLDAPAGSLKTIADRAVN